LSQNQNKTQCMSVNSLVNNVYNKFGLLISKRSFI
jgi:hypothetical protein